MGKETEARFRGNFIQRGITKVLEKADINYQAIGTENLNKFRDLLDQGESAGAILNHPAYSDYPTGAAIVVKEGLNDVTARSQLLMSDKYANSILLRVPVRTLGKLIGLDIVALRSHRFGGDKGNQKM
ncbi:hypothetical protein HYW39_00595, partial [Candidatus Curtissbacteria bacterium]|nr:hypothetical protein [Candidatus Curtissbacteria bacterium]